MLGRNAALLLVLLSTAGCITAVYGVVPLETAGGPAQGEVAPAPTSAQVTLVPITDRIQITDPEARHSEFMVVRHPEEARTLAMAVINSDDPNGGRTCAVHLSEDGGRSWADITPPAWQQWGVVYDPWLTWTPDGALHALCIDNGEPDGPLVYARTRDLGQTWTTRSVPGGGGDKSVLGHFSDGSLVACSAKGELLAISRSFDAGDSWETQDHAGFGNMCNGLLGTIDGAMHALWLSEEAWPYDVPFGLLTSRDGGATWTKSYVDTQRTHYGNDPACAAAREQVDPSAEPGFTVFFGCGAVTGLAREDLPSFTQPIIVASPISPTLLIAHHEFLDSQQYVLKLLRSTDAGASFHEIGAPTSGAPCDVLANCHYSRPVPGYDAEGRLGLLWREGDSASGWRIWFTVSLDDGSSWAAPVQLGASDPTTSMFHPRSLAPHPTRLANGAVQMASDPQGDPVAYAGQSLFLSAFDGVNGDGAHYWGMGYSDEGFVPMWVDGQGNGTPQVWARVVAVG